MPTCFNLRKWAHTYLKKITKCNNCIQQKKKCIDLKVISKLCMALWIYDYCTKTEFIISISYQLIYKLLQVTHDIMMVEFYQRNKYATRGAQWVPIWYQSLYGIVSRKRAPQISFCYEYYRIQNWWLYTHLCVINKCIFKFYYSTRGSKEPMSTTCIFNNAYFVVKENNSIKKNPTLLVILI